MRGNVDLMTAVRKLGLDTVKSVHRKYRFHQCYPPLDERGQPNKLGYFATLHDGTEIYMGKGLDEALENLPSLNIEQFEARQKSAAKKVRWTR